MIVCIKCRKEMIVKKIGIEICYMEDSSHRYSADIAECPVCRTLVAYTDRGQGCFHSTARVEGATYIDMNRKEG